MGAPAPPASLRLGKDRKAGSSALRPAAPALRGWEALGRGGSRAGFRRRQGGVSANALQWLATLEFLTKAGARMGLARLQGAVVGRGRAY